MECKVSHPHVTKCHACHAKRCYVTVETSKNNAFCNVSHRYGNFLPRHQHVHMSRSATPATQNEATSRWKRTKTRPFATFPIGTATFRHDSNTCTCQEVLLEKIAPKYRRIITDIYSIFFWFLLHSFIIPHFLWVPWQHPGSS